MRVDLQSTLDAQAKTQKHSRRAKKQNTIEEHTNNAKDQLIQELPSGTTFTDAKNDRGLKQLEQAKRATPNDIEEETERSARAVATGFPPDTSEATTRKFLEHGATRVTNRTGGANPLHRRPKNTYVPC